MTDENLTPTPHNETVDLPSVIPEKNFFKKPKKVRLPGSYILPAHRIIFQNYKDQNFKSLAKAIRQTGVYSEGVAERVTQITKSKSWKALMDEMMPEEHLALRHSELLDKREVRVIQDEDGRDIEVDNGPDTAAVSKGLELAYKLRGSFQKEEAPPASTVMYNLFYKPEIRQQMKVFEDGIKQSLLHEINKRNLADIETEEENQSNLDQAGSGEHNEGNERQDTDNGGGGGSA
jgi:hypothetical protein